MIDALTDFIIKPSAPFAAGVVLFTVVWGFFKGVESVLTDDTKLEIAVWLLGVKVGQKLEPWPETFAKVFDRVTKNLIVFIVLGLIGIIGIRLAMYFAPRASTGSVVTPASK
jgi:hypothetical protein